VLVPPAIAAFRAAHPGIELSLVEAEPDEAADALRDGRIDVAVVYDYDFERVLDPAGLELHALMTDAMLVALPGDHELAGLDPVPLERLGGETWIASADPICNRQLRHSAGLAGFAPKVAFASDDYGAIGRLVDAGVGVALVPQLAAAAVGDAVVVRPPGPVAYAADQRRRGPCPLGRCRRDARTAQVSERSIHFPRDGGRQPMNASISVPARCSTTSMSRCSGVTKRSSTAWSRNAASSA
jgi:DNA-binding transcriptional LysR family regulator